ncbi:MAG: hypothetical protein OHK0015_01610 [Chloroflexi bacterium OHK40]
MPAAVRLGQIRPRLHAGVGRGGPAPLPHHTAGIGYKAATCIIATTLPGIGYKAATCVIAYSFGRNICPVATHTYRVAVRLGLILLETPALGRKVHLAIEMALTQGERLGFHINAMAHGRCLCSVERPVCDGCPVAEHCVAPERGRYSRQGGEGADLGGVG